MKYGIWKFIVALTQKYLHLMFNFIIKQVLNPNKAHNTAFAFPPTQLASIKPTAFLPLFFLAPWPSFAFTFILQCQGWGVKGRRAAIFSQVKQSVKAQTPEKLLTSEKKLSKKDKNESILTKCASFNNIFPFLTADKGIGASSVSLHDSNSSCHLFPFGRGAGVCWEAPADTFDMAGPNEDWWEPVSEVTH